MRPRPVRRSGPRGSDPPRHAATPHVDLARGGARTLNTRLDPQEIRRALEAFDLGGHVVEVEPHGTGHIHSTFRSEVELPSGQRRAFLHQQLNEEVFRDLDALMANVELVTRTLRSGEGGESLELVPTRDGRSYTRFGSSAWRTFHFLDGTVSHDRCPSPEYAFEAARAFGAFQGGLAGLDPARLSVTIPDFFSGPARVRQFHDALGQASPARLEGLEADLEFAERGTGFLAPIDEAIRRGDLPPRVVHGDTKLNNVLFEARAPRARCVVDLDTTMSAWSPYDFGDLVRFTSATADEDERDLARMDADPELLRALTAGWVESTQAFATRAERELLADAAVAVTFLIGLRFLTDHIAGDVYFRIHRPGHNLDRARAQFQLARRLVDRRDHIVP